MLGKNKVRRRRKKSPESPYKQNKIKNNALLSLTWYKVTHMKHPVRIELPANK